MATEQERGDWEFPWPSDGEACPQCGCQIETQEFSTTNGVDLMAWCVGLNGTKQEDADEGEDGCGCGWCGQYYVADRDRP